MRLVIFCFLMISLFPLHAYSEEFATTSVASHDGSIVVAVHPYFSKEERKHFSMARKFKRLIPVGVIIQNYSNETIGIERINISSKNKNKIFLHRFNPYIERAYGDVVDHKFEHDSRNMNRELNQKYAASYPPPILSINEIFYSPKLRSGHAHYGLVYLDKRNDTLRPDRVKNLNGLALTIPIVSPGSLRENVWTLPLDGNSGHVRETKNNYYEKIYVGKPEDKPSNIQLYEARKALSDCFARSAGKQETNNKFVYYGNYAEANIVLNKYGDYLSHELVHSYRSSKLNKSINEASKGMSGCIVPISEKREEEYEKQPFYSYSVIIGDVKISGSKKDR